MNPRWCGLLMNPRWCGVVTYGPVVTAPPQARCNSPTCCGALSHALTPGCGWSCGWSCWPVVTAPPAVVPPFPHPDPQLWVELWAQHEQSVSPTTCQCRIQFPPRSPNFLSPQRHQPGKKKKHSLRRPLCHPRAVECVRESVCDTQHTQCQVCQSHSAYRKQRGPI